MNHKNLALFLFGLVTIDLALYIVGFHGLYPHGDMNYYNAVLTQFLADGTIPFDNPTVYAPLLLFGALTQNVTLAGELTTLLGVSLCIFLTYLVARRYLGETPAIISMLLAYASPLLFVYSGILQQLYGYIPIIMFLYFAGDVRRKVQFLVLPGLVGLAMLTHMGALAIILCLTLLAVTVYHHKALLTPLGVSGGLTPALMIFPDGVKLPIFLNPTSHAFVFQLGGPATFTEWSILFYGLLALPLGAYIYMKKREPFILLCLLFLGVLLAPITFPGIYNRLIMFAWLPATFLLTSYIQNHIENPRPQTLLIFALILSHLPLLFITMQNIFFSFIYILMFYFVALTILTSLSLERLSLAAVQNHPKKYLEVIKRNEKHISKPEQAANITTDVT